MYKMSTKTTTKTTKKTKVGDKTIVKTTVKTTKKPAKRAPKTEKKLSTTDKYDFVMERAEATQCGFSDPAVVLGGIT